jgi:hypothetical protein
MGMDLSSYALCLADLIPKNIPMHRPFKFVK